MSALVTFRDFDPVFNLWTKPPWYDAGKKHNKIGYVTEAGKVVYPSRCGLMKAPIEAIKGRDHALISLPFGAEHEKVDSFFTDNRENADLFFQGINAILTRDFSTFVNPIKLPLLQPVNATEYKGRWRQFVSLLQPPDLIFVLDTRSILSKAIAALDHGVWSHVAQYVGDGQIVEATTAGVVERSVTVYNTGVHRLGLYRPTGSGDATKVVAFGRSQIGKRYNYKGVLRLGINKFLKIRPQPRILGDHPSNPNFALVSFMPSDHSPNDLAMRPGLELLYVV
jgi:hypothetical protein